LQYYYQTLAAKIKNVTDWGRQNSFIPLDLDLPDEKNSSINKAFQSGGLKTVLNN